ncbi:MAG: hypothetical protein LQ337_003380 [Flavoplaca oasis]|nr:MAG: hypothetical protein LQ337_003380 [Flavoplaca oasis]
MSIVNIEQAFADIESLTRSLAVIRGTEATDTEKDELKAIISRRLDTIYTEVIDTDIPNHGPALLEKAIHLRKVMESHALVLPVVNGLVRAIIGGMSDNTSMKDMYPLVAAKHEWAVPLIMYQSLPKWRYSYHSRDSCHIPDAPLVLAYKDGLMQVYDNGKGLEDLYIFDPRAVDKIRWWWSKNNKVYIEMSFPVRPPVRISMLENRNIQNLMVKLTGNCRKDLELVLRESWMLVYVSGYPEESECDVNDGLFAS